MNTTAELKFYSALKTNFQVNEDTYSAKKRVYGFITSIWRQAILWRLGMLKVCLPAKLPALQLKLLWRYSWGLSRPAILNLGSTGLCNSVLWKAIIYFIQWLITHCHLPRCREHSITSSWKIACLQRIPSSSWEQSCQAENECSPGLKL